MRNTLLLAAAVLLLLPACGRSDAPARGTPVPMRPGETMFNAQCSICHGRKGDLGLSGAKDLTKSTLSREEMIAIVTNGKGGMMAYAKVLSAPEIEQVVDHARSLKTTE